MNSTRISSLLVVAAAAAFCGSASAQVKTWNFADRAPNGSCTGSFAGNDGSNGITGGTSANGNVINCTQQPSGTTTDLFLRAYSTTGSGGAFETGAVNDQSGNGVAVYGRGEVRDGAAPNHAIDNSGSIDAMLLSFTSSEILRSITVGWAQPDGDFQVLRWVGASDANQATVGASIVGRTAANMLQSNGGSWQLVALVDGGGPGDTNQTFNSFNTTNASSSYWLISAYNGGFGGSGFTSGVDAIKLLGVSTGRVSAPGTLALAGLGLLGAAFLRRRNA